MLESLLAGILGGLVSSSIVFVWVTYWRRALVPWYENRVYQGLRIDGEWETEGSFSGKPFSEVAHVHQKAYTVRGTTIYTSGDQVEEYAFEGEFRNLILTAWYWAPGSNDLDRGTFTLAVKDSGYTLEGFFIGYIDQASSVSSGTYVWRRRSQGPNFKTSGRTTVGSPQPAGPPG